MHTRLTPANSRRTTTVATHSAQRSRISFVPEVTTTLFAMALLLRNIYHATNEWFEESRGLHLVAVVGLQNNDWKISHAITRTHTHPSHSHLRRHSTGRLAAGRFAMANVGHHRRLHVRVHVAGSDADASPTAVRDQLDHQRVQCPADRLECVRCRLCMCCAGRVRTSNKS